MEWKQVTAVTAIVVLILTSSFLAYDDTQQRGIVHERNIFINETLSNLEAETMRADTLNATMSARDSLIIELENEISSKQKKISQQQVKIREIEDIAEKQEEEIQHLREVQASLQEEGKIIVDQWDATLILYDDVDIYEKQSPFMELVKENPISYNKIGIPFIYFRDETRTVENGVILGSYSTLYNYIYIYKDNTEIRTIYHEIAHIIYQKMFVPSQSNLQSWRDFYNDLKDANLLSTEYSKTNEIEGFAEEYSVYKTKVKDQPEAVKDFFKQVDDILD